jgi:prepilin-type N-terminal cleavage/methylation domain-containing protein
MPVPRQHQGFTLIEVAIVIVITGLLMGWVLKGMELITSARVRNLISQQDNIRGAYFGFYDRFRALPGDYPQASTSISGVGTACGTNGNGNGDGRVDGAGATPSSDEYILAWEHLSKSGFLHGASYTCGPVESATTTPTNPFGAFLNIAWDTQYAASGPVTPRHHLKTGNQIPSDLLAELDRKMDDGSATSGSFRFSNYNGGGMAAPTGSGVCYQAAAPNAWSAASPAANCGGTNLF